MIAPPKRLSSLLRGVAITSLWLVAGMAHAGTKHYYYTDPQGTVLAKADEQGVIVSRNDYAPYGSASPNMDAAPDGPGYTGHVNDPDTGLVYMQARYYDPVVGRFLSEDPVGPAVGNPYNFNRFAYANNNPIVNMDADGRTAILDSQNVIDGPGHSIAVNPNEQRTPRGKIDSKEIPARVTLAGHQNKGSFSYEEYQLRNQDGQALRKENYDVREITSNVKTYGSKINVNTSTSDQREVIAPKGIITDVVGIARIDAAGKYRSVDLSKTLNVEITLEQTFSVRYAGKPYELSTRLLHDSVIQDGSAKNSVKVIIP